jgi:hypothetical protein
LGRGKELALLRFGQERRDGCLVVGEKKKNPRVENETPKERMIFRFAQMMPRTSSGSNPGCEEGSSGKSPGSFVAAIGWGPKLSVIGYGVLVDR